MYLISRHRKNINWKILRLAVWMQLVFASGLMAQQVNISRDINVRNDFAYDVLAIENEIVFLGTKALNFTLIYSTPIWNIAGRLNWFWMRESQ